MRGNGQTAFCYSCLFVQARQLKLRNAIEIFLVNTVYAYGPTGCRLIDICASGAQDGEDVVAPIRYHTLGASILFMMLREVEDREMRVGDIG